ncbi:MAG TPA: NUDIX domain-containing protein [Amycolatopsis sp.]|uniref:NUDIX domain-containing protein n=1 Tax=Amycolatopsis sp. TaxID=37632 RepID=UPI002B499F64|nr:NUDIX domain-containing protein [Amycolatopsis sp.]HKS44727.1 NUDIX domain-containing protein [Amycolatopsis sp.]
MSISGRLPTACAVRELDEEFGIQLDPAHLLPGATWFRMSREPRIDIFFSATSWDGTPGIREAHKCTELVGADPNNLPGDAIDFLADA